MVYQSHSTSPTSEAGDTSLSSIWREACRHLDMQNAVVNIALLLTSRLHSVRLGVFELNKIQSSLVKIGDSQPVTQTTPDLVLNSTAQKQLRRWVAERVCKSIHELRDETPLLARALEEHCHAGSVVGGLAGEHGALGVLLLEPLHAKEFSTAHIRFATLLLEPVSAALDNHRRLRELNLLRAATEAENLHLRHRLGRGPAGEPVIGATAGLRGVLERVGRVCNSDLPVLILGETGSGKEVVAREIHSRSARVSRAFIRVNCGAIPPELIDSELFGHEKGSFTGATAQRLGWFERAHLGTLFLDEIGDLPSAAQVRLLRVLQDGLIQRVGGQVDVAVDVRIVAATHRDLPKLIQEGRFREDLWYRLATFPIILPPLRERRGDIPALAAHFARRAAARFGLKVRLPEPSDLALLTTYEWPGNVRELQAVLDRAAILGDGERLEIGKALGTPGMSARPPSRERSANPPAAKPLTLDSAMRRHIEEVLTATQGRIEGPHGAAKVLAINPHTLRARMRKLQIKWNKFKDRES